MSEKGDFLEQDAGREQEIKNRIKEVEEVLSKFPGYLEKISVKDGFIKVVAVAVNSLEFCKARKKDSAAGVYAEMLEDLEYKAKELLKIYYAARFREIIAPGYVAGDSLTTFVKIALDVLGEQGVELKDLGFSLNELDRLNRQVRCGYLKLDLRKVPWEEAEVRKAFYNKFLNMQRDFKFTAEELGLSAKEFADLMDVAAYATKDVN